MSDVRSEEATRGDAPRVIRPFRLADTEQVVALWHDSGLTRPWNDPHRDIERKLAVQPELFVVAVDGDRVVGTVMAGYDGHRGWLYYLATARDRRGEGIGRALVAHAEAALVALGCPKVQLMVRPDNAAARGFYDALGYQPEEIWLTGKRLIPDDTTAPVPAPDADDAGARGRAIVSLTVHTDERIAALGSFEAENPRGRAFRYNLGTIPFDEPDAATRATALESTIDTLLDVLDDAPRTAFEAADIILFVTFGPGAQTLPSHIVRRLAARGVAVWIDT